VAGEPTTRKPNRLIHEKSPYLLQHAHNPVDWYPWGDEAFEKARRENKPIFLSIGYSTCHWCHVMERESFENEEIAALMNKYFVSIKLDREERPDIDKIYMTATQAMTGSGGWPMSVWLTPDLKPFFCGTYFPPESRYGRAGFKEILQKIHEIWQSNRDGVVQQANQITDFLTQSTTFRGTGAALNDAPLRLGLEQFRNSYDKIHGGFGAAPKFPRPVALNFLFRAGGKDMALFTLRKMGEGGLFDQLGGGFHRYSVDERWLVSHFEKMLYDQAQLVSSYLDAYQITHEPFFADIARRTCDYVLRDMTSPDGGFYSAEDADSEGVEGKFYVWRKDEIGDDAMCEYFGVTAEGNWEHGNNILYIAGKPPLPNLEEWRQKLFAAREKRIRPHRDEKILTSWNGLMISALARAAQILDDEKYLRAAERAARHILQHHYAEKRLKRTPTVAAIVDDYAFFANALVDLHETDFDPQWLFTAIELADTMLKQFYDTKDGGFFMTSGEDKSVIVRAKEDYDGAEPSGNSMATMLLLRLAQFTDRADYREAAQKTLSAFELHMRKAPHAVPQMLCALDFYLSKPKQIVIAGKPDAADTRAMLRAVRERYLPNKILIVADGGERQQKLAKLLPFLETVKPMDGKATAFVCENYVCKLPTTDLAAMVKLIVGEKPKEDKSGTE
jgi:uncharacterized protein YyaL (SSP411 family)